MKKNILGKKNIKKWRRFFSVGLFLICWEMFVRMGVLDAIMVSSPSKIFHAGLELIKAGVILPHVIISLEAFTAGLILAIFFGMFIGLIIGSNEKVYDFFWPFIFLLSVLPKVAIIPLVIIWFGIGIGSKIIIIFMMAITPILINVIDGARGVNKEYLEMACSFGAKKGFLLRHLFFFDTLPHFFSGVRIAIGRGVSGIVVAEVFGYGVGLGSLIARYGASYQTARLMFAILILVLFSLVFLWLNEVIRKKVICWE